MVELAKLYPKSISPEVKVTKEKNSTATVAVKVQFKTLTLKTKNTIKHRDSCCQFKNNFTGKMCGSKYFLEVDHIQPRFAEGTHDIQNLGK